MSVLTRDRILHEIDSGRLQIEPLMIHPGVRGSQVVLTRTEGDAVYSGRFRDPKEI